LKIQSHVGLIGLALLSLFFTACGGGDGPSGSEPTLGITSIERMGATAIPNNNIASGKPLMAKYFVNGIKSLFGEKTAHAAVGTCPASTPTSFGIPGGIIWLDEVFIILDEVQFNLVSSSNSPDNVELGPFGLDLLNTEIGISQSIKISVPTGAYKSVRFRVKRVDDTQSSSSKVPPALIAKILDPVSSKKRRPSVWIRGLVSLDAAPTTCQDFTFVTDRRWEETISFSQFSGGSLDVVLELNLEKAFNAALDLLGKNATAFRDEIGTSNQNTLPQEQLGAVFLDGRKKDPDHGTEIAGMIADQLPLHFRILTQSASVIDFESAVAGTIIDDSAETVSQPVNEADIKDCTQDLDCP